MEQKEADGLFWMYADVEETAGPGKALSFAGFVGLNQRWRVFTEADLSKFVGEYPPSAAVLCQFGAGVEGYVRTLRWRFGEMGKEAEMELQWLLQTVEEGKEMEAAWLGFKLLDAATKEVLGSLRLAAFIPACFASFEAALVSVC